MIKTGIESLRDPFLLYENGVYYMYGTGVDKDDWNNTAWLCYKNDSGNINGAWKQTEKLVYELPRDAEKNRWAPEVHKYKGAYYMLATYYSSVTAHRGCTVLKADTPEGVFKEISGGHITPKDWDAIDGTLYIDNDGQPWMVFVHEWTSTEDGIGRMAAAKLSDDLSHFISEPVELFRADSPAWTDHCVTDGCYLYKTSEGQLLMIWSNFAQDGYCIGVARSESGKVTGPWVQDERRLISREVLGKNDGGHGMLFKDTDGKLYICFHSPNKPNEDGGERAVIVRIKEQNNCIIVDDDIYEN